MVMSVVPKWESRVDERQRKEQGRDERRRFIPERAGQPVHHEHRADAGRGRQAAADQKERLPVDWPARDEISETLERPRHDSPRVVDEVQAGQHPCTTRGSRRRAA